MNIEHFIRVHTSLSSFPSAASSEKHVYLIIVLSKQFMTLKEKMEVTNTAEKITHMYPTNKKVQYRENQAAASVRDKKRKCANLVIVCSKN
ncbi:hypothetical protein QE152_g32368 [Popillia japonica]|uniref:Uncharacterized protein n=1 Tax=Popillia japonica TaxID=7064 RepID=A0AAW1IZL8_POPJA